MIPIHELRDLSKFSTDQLEAERDEAILGIGAIKQKLLRLPAELKVEKMRMLSAKMAYGSVHQVVCPELGRRRRARREARLKTVEATFVTLAKERLPDDVFQDLLDEAVEVAREADEPEIKVVP